MRTVRARLTLLHVAAMLLVLGVYAATVYTLVRFNVSNALDERLRGDFQWATSMVEQQPDGTLVWWDGEENFESPWLQVWSQDGQSVFSTTLASRFPVPASETLTRHPDDRIVSVTTPTERFLILTDEVTISERPLVI